MGIDRKELEETLLAARDALLRNRCAGGYWIGELSSSALSTATAVCALGCVDRDAHNKLIRGGLEWLARNANGDGGWGDTVVSASNLSTTLLVRAAFAGAPIGEKFRSTIENADAWIARSVGTMDPERIAKAVQGRYGDDRSFSAPILAMCAIGGLLGPEDKAWDCVPPLPFELAAVPHRLLGALRLPVVSYALPALIAIGQVREHHRPTRNSLVRLLRKLARGRTLKILSRIQPGSGGFLEAPPLTSFVVMSLAAMHVRSSPVVEKGVRFLTSSVRGDGSWSIDTNLATWVTTLSINALQDGADFADGDSGEQYDGARCWLLDQQHLAEHPYTRARPGGWAWTDLPGGVPDADDTAGALLALRDLPPVDGRVIAAASRGATWLAGIQNTDGGVPTFSRGWRALPFDLSSPDLTAHALRSWTAWLCELPSSDRARVEKSIVKAVSYLAHVQRDDGAWVPLWFGNESARGQENPTYGTARVLLGLTEFGDMDQRSIRGMLRRGVEWLLGTQHTDGGWGGDASVDPSIEETALAVDALGKCLLRLRNAGFLELDRVTSAIERGVGWLVRRTERGRRFDPSPIGLYFAKLWYYERLYPLIFTVSALGRVRRAGL